MTLLVFARHAQTHGSYSIAWWLVAMLAMSLAVAWLSGRELTAVTIVGWAITMRLIAGFTPAFFEDDYFRFLWDGYRIAVDGNPYRLAPAEYFATFSGPDVMQEVLSHVNHPNVPTIYGPALEHLFALAATIEAGALWPWKLIVSIADVSVVAVLVRAFGSRALLYAWSPLVLHEVAVAAHPDGLMGALILLAYQAARRREPWLLAIFVGTAVAMKVHAILALPFLVMLLPASVDRATASVATIGIYALYWLPYFEGLVNAWYSFATFARTWQFNALGFQLFSTLPSPVGRALSLAAIAAMIAAAWCWQMRNSAARLPMALLMAFGALLFFSPVVNPWYLLCLLPLACATRYATPWAAACVLPLSYASDFNLGFASVSDGRLPVWVSGVQWVAIVGAAIWDWRARNTLDADASLASG